MYENISMPISLTRLLHSLLNSLLSMMQISLRKAKYRVPDLPTRIRKTQFLNTVSSGNTGDLLNTPSLLIGYPYERTAKTLKVLTCNIRGTHPP